MTTLREAAQALLAALGHPAGSARKRKIEAATSALRERLAAPPEPGWGEGYRAGVEAAEAALPCELMNGVGRCEGMAPCESCASVYRMRSALPVPSAPTQAPELPGSHKVWCATLYSSGTGPCNCGVRPAPEAKTAESEVFWVVRSPHPLAAEFPQPWHRDYEAARWERDTLPGGPWEIVKVTVEPAPVEPEETHQ